jgi:hypothetical protein
LRILSSRVALPAICVFGLGIVVNVFSSPVVRAQLPARERDALADRFVHDKLALWQKRLRLEDWKISLIVSHPSDLRRGTLGNIHWDADQKTAKIRVLSASDYNGSLSDALKDMEFTVVHELIHLELSPVTRSEESRSAESRTAEEDAVNRMADTLLELDHKK